MAIPDGKPATDFSAMNREWVRTVATEAAESGSIGLPPVTADDNGKILGVVNGAWGAMDAGGGGGESSDVNTANITVAFTAEGNVTFEYYEIYDYQFPLENFLFDADSTLGSQNNVITVPIGKGNSDTLFGEFSNIFAYVGENAYHISGEPTCSGNITHESNKYIVTGDGTITATVVEM